MKRRRPELIRALLAALAVVTVGLGEVAAQVPEPAVAPQEGAVLPLLLALGLLVAGGLVMAAVVLLRLRQGEPPAPAQAAARRSSSPPKVWLPITRRAAAQGARVTTAGAEAEADEARGAVLYEDAAAERALTPTAAPRVDCLDTSVNGMSCPRCHALYDVGAHYCPIDGEALALVEIDPAATEADEVEMICSVCGERARGEGGFCPRDGGRLQPAEPGVHVYAAVPVMFCPQTQDELPPGLPRPAGSPPLIPLLGRKSCGVSIAGPGPKRRLCPECGTRYPLEASWCGLDQARLVNIN